MPQDVSFALPFEAAINVYETEARVRHVSWLRGSGLVRSEEGLHEYLSWDLPQAVARTYPFADGEDLVMFMNWFSLAFLFDDQFDANAEGRPDRIAEVARELITIPYRPVGTPPDVVCPITLAWAEVWAEMSRGMSQAWCDRFASAWARFLAAHAGEARLAAEGTVLGLDEYLDLRRHTVGIHHSLDAVERSRHFEVPAQVQAHELTREMRTAAVDVIAFMNDIHSLEREERRGDPHNLVTVLRRHLGCGRQEAIGEAVEMVRGRLDRYQELESGIPSMCQELGLSKSQVETVEMSAEGIRNWIRGNHDWGLSSGRYTAEKSGATADAEKYGRGFVDDLLSTPVVRAGAA